MLTIQPAKSNMPLTVHQQTWPIQALCKVQSLTIVCFPISGLTIVCHSIRVYTCLKDTGNTSTAQCQLIMKNTLSCANLAFWLPQKAYLQYNLALFYFLPVPNRRCWHGIVDVPPGWAWGHAQLTPILYTTTCHLFTPKHNFLFVIKDVSLNEHH